MLLSERTRDIRHKPKHRKFYLNIRRKKITV